MTKQNDKFKTVKFESLIDFAVVHTPNTKFNKSGEYKVNLRLTSQTEVDKLKKILKDNNVSEMVLNVNKGEMEPRIKDNGDGTFTMAVKRPAVNQAGKEAVITVVDSQNNPIPKNILIGNGSRAIVEMFAYTGEKGKGVLRLSGIQVLDLVPYSPPSSFEKVSGGFTVSSATSSAGNVDSIDEEAAF